MKIRTTTLNTRWVRHLPGLPVLFTLIVTVLAPFMCARAELNDEVLKQSIVNVNGYEGRNIESEGTGFVVSADRYNGYVVTNAALIAGADTVTVNVPGSGAELVAQELKTKLALDFAVLKVNGLDQPALPIAESSAKVGDVVWSAVKWSHNTDSIGLSKGSVNSSYRMPDGEVGLIRHTAMIAEGGVGSVLLNNCGQVLGLNMGFNDRDGGVRAIDGESLRSLLASQNIKTTTASGGCVSAVVLAREEAELASKEAQRANEEAAKAQAAAQKLEEKLARTEVRNEQLVDATRAARDRADQAIAAAERARQNAEETRLELERRTSSIRAEAKALMDNFERDQKAVEERFHQALEAQQAQAATRQWMLMSVAAVVLGVVLIASFVWRGRNATSGLATSTGGVIPQAKSHTEMHKQDLAEYVLDGRDEDGIRYLLRISGDQLDSQEGVVIGRSPKDSPYIINHADVSRKHARIKVMKNRIFIEDLGSTNGTSVNGQSIEDKGPVSVADGDQIIIGSVVMKLRVLAA